MYPSLSRNVAKEITPTMNAFASGTTADRLLASIDIVGYVAGKSLTLFACGAAPWLLILWALHI